MKTNFFVLLVALALPAHAEYQPWDRIGIDTNADLSIPVPLDGKTTNFRSWDSKGTQRWGWVEAEQSGDWRSWDNQRGWQWGRFEVER